jgi:large subunit ribosomal protein L31
MKKKIHPTYYHNVKVTCSCGNTFVTGSTIQSITTELCSQCHPFYTGEQKIVDTANLVSKFEERRKRASKKVLSKKEKQALKKKKRASSRSTGASSTEQTLKDMLKGMSK